MTASAIHHLRHSLATLAYRARKAVHGAPPEFAGYRNHPDSRTPSEILAHMGDLFDWALHISRGAHTWHTSAPLSWDEEVRRFFVSLATFDDRLAGAEPLGCPAEILFQGPIADALTHTGQLTLLRRMAGSPIRGENYAKARIAAGRVGLEQEPAVFEFD